MPNPLQLLRAAVATTALLGSCALPTERFPVTPQRPTFSSDTNTAAEGSYELEAGGVVAKGGTSSVPVTLRHGATARTEVFAGWLPHLRVESPGSNPGGAGDLTLGVRHRFVEGTEERPALAFQSVVKLPTADEDRGLGTGEPDLLLAGIASGTLGGLGVTGFAELDFLGDPDGGILFGQSGALALSHALPESLGPLGWFGEVAGIVVPEQDAEQYFSTIGFTYGVSPSLVLDAGVILGLNDEAPDSALFFGLTRNFGRPGARARVPRSE